MPINKTELLHFLVDMKNAHERLQIQKPFKDWDIKQYDIMMFKNEQATQYYQNTNFGQNPLDFSPYSNDDDPISDVIDVIGNFISTLLGM